MRTVLAVALLLFAGACDSSTGPKETHLGSYRLQSIDGNALPATLMDVPDLLIEITMGTFWLKPDRTYTTSTSYRVTDEDVVGTHISVGTGSYTVRRNVLTFTEDENGYTFTGRFDGETLRIIGEDDADWTFVRV